MATAVQHRLQDSLGNRSSDASLAGISLPIRLRPDAPMTDEELIEFSRRNRPFRIEQNAQGELEVMSPVGTEGGHREAAVNAKLFAWAEQHGGVVFSSNAGFRLRDGSVLSPDAAWVSDARWNALSTEEQRRFAPICPEFLIEILSESDSRPVLEAKMQLWITNGAELAWMVDPFSATVNVYRPEAPLQVLQRPEFVTAEEPVAGFRLNTAQLWL